MHTDTTSATGTTYARFVRVQRGVIPLYRMRKRLPIPGWEWPLFREARDKEMKRWLEHYLQYGGKAEDVAYWEETHYNERLGCEVLEIRMIPDPAV